MPPLPVVETTDVVTEPLPLTARLQRVVRCARDSRQAGVDAEDFRSSRRGDGDSDVREQAEGFENEEVTSIRSPVDTPEDLFLASQERAVGVDDDFFRGGLLGGDADGDFQ